MNTNPLIAALAAFVAGVFVGAGLWFALVVLAVGLAAWRWFHPRPPPDRWFRR